MLPVKVGLRCSVHAAEFITVRSVLGIGLRALSDCTYIDLTEGQTQPLSVSAHSALTLNGLDQSVASDLTQFRQPGGNPKLSCCINGCRV